MTRDETKQLLMRIDVTFPSWKPKDLGLLVDVWQEEFADYPYQVVLSALKAFISSDRQGFAPAIGQIKGMIVDMQDMLDENNLSEMEAWALVSRAIRNSAYGAQEEFDKFPKLIQRAVGSPQNLKAWGLDDNYNENVAQSHFLSAYKSACKQEKQMRCFSDDVKAMLGCNQEQRLLTGEGCGV